MDSISLSELTTFIQGSIRDYFESPLWVRAEISEMRENANGHCYLELIEKDKRTDNLIAKIRANIWSSTYGMLQPYFESATGEKLRSGMSVLVMVNVDFHGVFGLSLNIKDIDPNYTLGALAARKLQIIKQLQDDGIMEMNKSLEISPIPQRIAVISSPTAAGFEDFKNQLHGNPFGFQFYTSLFPAIMQGDQAEASIIAALDRIYEHLELFDAAIIIRGGGASTDMACFDTYELASHCAQFPLPIIAGIGHQRDLSIVDMVAYQSVKTPTAAADFLIDKLTDAEAEMLSAVRNIHSEINVLLQNENRRLNETRWRIRHALQNKTLSRSNLLERQHMRMKSALIQIQNKQQYKHSHIDRIQLMLKNKIGVLIQSENNKLDLLKQKINAHSPEFLLKHGYTITTFNGKRLSSKKEVKSGDEIRTWLNDGNIESTVN